MADLSRDEQTGLMLKLHTLNVDFFSCGAEPVHAGTRESSHAWWTDDTQHESEFVKKVMDSTIHELAETELRIDLDRSFRASRHESAEGQGDDASLKHTQGKAQVLSTLLGGASSKAKSKSKRKTGTLVEDKTPPSASGLIRREKAEITMKTLAAITKLQLNFRRRRKIKQAEEAEREQHRKEAKDRRRRSFMEMTSELHPHHPCPQESSHPRRAASSLH